MKEKKISSGQFFSLLLLTRLLSWLTYTPSGAVGRNTSDFLLFALIGCLMILLMAVPLLLLYRKNADRDILDLTCEISPGFAKFAASGYALLFLFFAFVTLTRLDMFAGTTVFPESDTTFFILLAAALSCYAATRGLEALGRAGSICLFIFCLSFAAVLLTMYRKVDLNNFSPLLYNGSAPVLKDALDIALWTVEPAAMLVLFPRVTGNRKKGFFIWLLAFSGLAQLVFFLMLGSLGDFALLQLFPVHTISVLCEFAVFEHLDEILAGTWILFAFMKLSFMLYLFSESLKKAFKRGRQELHIVFGGVAVAAVRIAASRNVAAYLGDTVIWTRDFLIPAFTIAIPLLVLLFQEKKRRPTR